MALYKPIVQEDGVTTNYHRILFVQVTTNKHNSIAVVSYIDNDARENEKNGDIDHPYKRSITYETNYNEAMTIPNAYAYLKTLSEFDGAKDI